MQTFGYTEKGINRYGLANYICGSKFVCLGNGAPESINVYITLDGR
ncbi:unnamed protein product, partial [marine sediment metagenome]